MSWPPTAKYLNDLNFSLPEKLDQFLTSLLTEKKPRLQLQKLPIFWSTDNFAPKLLGKNVITVSDGHAFHITSYDGTSIYVAQKLNQLNRHRNKLFKELFFIVTMENNKDTEILEFVVWIPIYSLSFFTMRWNYKE